MNEQTREAKERLKRFRERCIIHPYDQQAFDTIIATLEASERDTQRLDWLLANSHMQVFAKEGKAVVWDTSDGLVLAGKGNSGRDAIDAAMKEKGR